MPTNGREDSSPGIITRCLQDWRGGDEEALDRLTTAVYRELRRLAPALWPDKPADEPSNPWRWFTNSIFDGRRMNESQVTIRPCA